MGPFSTFVGILILAIPLAVAMPRRTETISFQVTSLEANADAHCGLGDLVNTCWRFCGDGEGEWCWIRPSVICKNDGDCDSGAPCSGACDKGDKGSKSELGNPGRRIPSESESGYPRPVANQVTFEKPTTNAVAPSRAHFSSSYTNANSLKATSLEASADAHCGLGNLANTCWRFCGDGEGDWCWIRPSISCKNDDDCDSWAPCSSGCDKGDKGSKSELGFGNRRIFVKLLIA